MHSNKVIIAAAAAACTMFLLLAAAADEQPPLGGSPPASHDSAAGTAALTVHGGKPPLRGVGDDKTYCPVPGLRCPSITCFQGCKKSYYLCEQCDDDDCKWNVTAPEMVNFRAKCQQK